MNRSMNRAASLLAALAAAGALAGALAGCATVQRDVLYEEGSAQSSALSDIELSLVALRVDPDPKALASLRSRIEAGLGESRTEPALAARRLALAADAALLSGDRRAAASCVARARAAYGGDELAALAEARLEPSAEKRASLLEKSEAAADSSARLRAERGAALVELGKYREALALLDPALAELPEAYLALYGPARDRALALRDAPEAAASAPGGGPAKAAPASRGGVLSSLGEGRISLGAMVDLALEETNAFDWFTGGASWASGAFFERLKGSGWFADSGATRATPAARRDAALFLWQLMSRGDAKRLRLYTDRYQGRASPVPDVPYGSPCFDAVLGVVEADVMRLPDGRNFRPDGPVGGLEYYGMLRAAASAR
jgi:hypothetical protein